MPECVLCLSLLRLCCKQVSKHIVKLCSNYQEWDLVLPLVSDILENDEAEGFKALRTEYDIPLQIKYNALEECLKTREDIKASLSGDSSEICYFLIHFFCLDENCLWQYDITTDVPVTFDLLIQIHANLTCLKLTAFVDDSLMERLLQNMNNITQLLFRNPITEKCFEIMGRNCSKLQHISCMDGTFTVTSEAARKLCFSNYPVNPVKNQVCSTLVTYYGEVSIDAIFILLENVRGLVRLPALEKLDHARFMRLPEIKHRQILPCNIELAHADKFNDLVPFDEIYTDYPQLKFLTVTCRVPQNIVVNPNLICLTINIFSVNPEKAFELSEWPNLLILEIKFTRNSPGVVDVSTIGKGCPQLKLLEFAYCEEKCRSSYPQFPHLQHFSLRKVILDGDSIVLNTSAPKLTTLWILVDSNNDLMVEDTLMGLDFLDLTVLICTPKVNYSCDAVINFLEHFPALKHFGLIPDEDLRSAVEQKCVERNWNLEIAGNKSIVTLNIL